VNEELSVETELRDWLQDQRAAFIRGQLSDDQIKKLDTMCGSRWFSMDTMKWHEVELCRVLYALDLMSFEIKSRIQSRADFSWTSFLDYAYALSRWREENGNERDPIFTDRVNGKAIGIFWYRAKQCGRL
jgi:hypothetical protein